jgi:hypothetical protein
VNPFYFSKVLYLNTALSAAPKIPPCRCSRRMLGLNPGLLPALALAVRRSSHSPARSRPHLLGGTKRGRDQRGCRHENLIKKELVLYLLMTSTTLFSFSVVQLGQISNLLGRSAGIVLDDRLAIYHSKFKNAGSSLIFFSSAEGSLEF